MISPEVETYDNGSKSMVPLVVNYNSHEFDSCVDFADTADSIETKSIKFFEVDLKRSVANYYAAYANRNSPILAAYGQANSEFESIKNDTENKALSDLFDWASKMSERMSISKIILQLKNQELVKSARRVEYLADLQDFEEGDKPLSSESALGFQKLILKSEELKALGEPALGLFSEGTLSASWKIAEDKHFLLVFLDSDQVSYALIGPDKNMPDGKFRTNGRSSGEKALEVLSNLGVMEWRG